MSYGMDHGVLTAACAPPPLLQAILARSAETGYRYVKLSSVHDMPKAATDLYIAAGMYFAFCLISLFFWTRALYRVRRFDSSPEDPGHAYFLHTS
jgi:hypothetical protein